jgi:hypothetical protein
MVIDDSAKSSRVLNPFAITAKWHLSYNTVTLITASWRGQTLEK